MRRIQVRCNLSVKQMIVLSQELSKVDKNIVERGSITDIQRESHSLDHFFSFVTLTEMDLVPFSSNEEIDFVYCVDLPKFIAYILEKRDITENFRLKFGINGGGNSIKVCKR